MSNARIEFWLTIEEIDMLAALAPYPKGKAERDATLRKLIVSAHESYIAQSALSFERCPKCEGLIVPCPICPEKKL